MVIKRLDLAYQAFFDYKAGKRPKVGLPRFKKRSKYSSFTLTQAGWKYEGGNQIRIGKRTFKFVLSRPLPTGIGGEGTIKTVTIKRDRCGDLWLCFSVIEENAADGSISYPTQHSDLAFGEFAQILRHVCHRRGVVLEQVERYYPSSKTCRQCGAAGTKLMLSDRHWRCACGVAHDRDHNAAVNIRDRAWSLFRGDARREGVPAIAA